MSAEAIGSAVRPLKAFVVSDATGATAEALLTTGLIQFQGARWLIRRFPLVRSLDQVREVVEEAAVGDSVILFTLVSPVLGAEMRRRCAERSVPCVDVLEPLISLFAATLERAPEGRPGLQRRQTENMFRLATAIDFALQHDDGKGEETLDEADVLLFGLSRSGKTPTCVYLSCRGIKAANVPIVKDLPAPERAARLRVPKVGLRMSLDRLLQIRTRRARAMGAEMPWYSNRSEVFAELDYCERYFRSIPDLHLIDVTNRSVEEISDLIVREVL